MSLPKPLLPKMMIGFVVRRCAVAIGHDPSAEEFAAWANTYREDGRTIYLFGRRIDVDEAAIILKHPGRPVTARSALPHEQCTDEPAAPAFNVTSFADAVARLRARRK